MLYCFTNNNNADFIYKPNNKNSKSNLSKSDANYYTTVNPWCMENSYSHALCWRETHHDIIRLSHQPQVDLPVISASRQHVAIARTQRETVHIRPVSNKISYRGKKGR